MVLLLECIVICFILFIPCGILHCRIDKRINADTNGQKQPDSPAAIFIVPPASCTVVPWKRICRQGG